MMGIELASATYYSRNLSQRVKEGIETKLKKGEYGAPAPLGYKNKNGNIIPNKNNSHFIKEIFKLYTTGDYSISQITNKLYLEGFRTVSYTHLRAHETPEHLVCRLLLEKKNKKKKKKSRNSNLIIKLNLI